MKMISMILAVLGLLVSCEKPLFPEDSYNTRLNFSTGFNSTRGNLDEYFSKINLMLFDADGNKAFDKAKSQTSDSENFGTFSLNIPEGTYTVVSVGHSSIKAATIASKKQVNFTASNGEKLTDTFCYYGDIDVTGNSDEYNLPMKRVIAMFRLYLTDSVMPNSIDRFKFDYTGGSANFNPSTSLGCTKSTQSEIRTINDDNIYEIYTFPYMSDSCKLKITISALDAEDNILSKRVLENVSVTRNRISEYEGVFFTEDPTSIQPVTTGFTVNGEWDGIDKHNF